MSVDVVMRMFGDVTGKEQFKAYRQVMRKGCGILAKETRRELRKIVGKKATSRNWWNGKTLSSGIAVKLENPKRAQVNIMKDFRLKFFEMGTDYREIRGNKSSRKTKTNRRYKKSGINRGRMKDKWFFDTAKRNSEKQIFSNMDKMLAESIQKIANKK